MRRPRKRSLHNSKVRVNKKRRFIPGGRKSEKRKSFLSEYKPKTETLTTTNINGRQINYKSSACWQPDGSYGFHTDESLCPAGFFASYGTTQTISHEHGQCVCIQGTDKTFKESR